MGKRRRKGWMCTMNFCLRQLGTLEFWETLLDSFGNLGPIAPIMLAMVESFFPPLPLIAIVALNVAAHGGILGFLYSWAGVALGGSIMFLFWRRVVKCFFWKFASRSPKLEKAQQWVNRFDTSSLFMLTLLPFAPSSFMHLAFGISDFDEKRYLITMLLGKGCDDCHDGSVWAVAGQFHEEPVVSGAGRSAVGRDVLGEQTVLQKTQSGIII